MKKVVCALLVLVVVLTMAVPAMASNMEVLFTADSSAKVGGHLEIDFNAMLLDGRVTSDIYNAILEKNYEIYWYRDGAFYSTQPKIIFGDSDANISFSVEVRFYADKACTQLRETLYSKDFKIQSSAPPMVLRTTAVNDGAVGMYYSFKFEASDPGAEFSLYRSSAPDGLTLAKDGTLSGTPTKTGTFAMTVVASGVGGQASYTYEITIGGEMQVVKIMTESLPNAVVGKAYSTKLECSDKSATFGIYYNPGKSNEFEATGLKLAEDGTISGTPTKAGTYTFCVGAYGMSEDSYKEFTLTVTEDKDENEGGKKKPGNKDKTDRADPTEDVTENKNDKTEKESKRETSGGVEMPVWAVLLIALGAMLVGVILAVILVKSKRK
jgi:hypothetical protein